MVEQKEYSRSVVVRGGSEKTRAYIERELQAAAIAAEAAERAKAAPTNGPTPAHAVVMKVEPTDPMIEGPKDHWLFRLYEWFCLNVIFNVRNRDNAILSPKWIANMRSRRFLGWFLLQPIRVVSFFQVQLSGNVEDQVYAKRMDACGKCRFRRVRIVKPNHVEAKLGLKYTQRDYCSLCGCPEWAPSELQNKNRKVGWHCPQRRHDGPYPDDGWRLALPVNKRTGGCSTCGGGNQ